MSEKKKSTNSRNIKTEKVKVQDIEHQIAYPGQEEFNLRNVTYAPAENSYLNESGQENSDEA